MSSNLAPSIDEDQLPVRTVRIPQSSSTSAESTHTTSPSYPGQKGTTDPYGHLQSSFEPPVPYQQYHSYHTQGHPSQRLQSVVTGSFGSHGSYEDGRDDYRGQRYATNHAARHALYRQDHHAMESRYPEEGYARDVGEQRDAASAFHAPPTPGGSVYSTAVVPPSPNSKRSAEEMLRDARESAGPTFKTPSNRLRRSFWHHSNPDDRKHDPMMPTAFTPPKNSKTGKPPSHYQEKLVTVRPDKSEGWVHRTSSWHPQYHQPHPQAPRAHSFPAPPAWNAIGPEPPRLYHRELQQQVEYPNQWSSHDRPPPAPLASAFSGVAPHRDPQSQHGPYDQRLSRSNSFSPPGAQWRGSNGGEWVPPLTSSPTGNQPGINASWSGSLGHRGSDIEMHRSVTFESGGSGDMMDGDRGRGSFDKGLPPPMHSPAFFLGEAVSRKPAAASDSSKRGYSNAQKEGRLTKTERKEYPLLAQPDDRIALSEILCVIRENVEVFQATLKDVEAPAPGRKHPVVVGQIGLRCIHCADCKAGDKVKRAICYPACIQRLYRTIIDMKLDHFPDCPLVPQQVKDKLEELKEAKTRSTGTTMQYFISSAKSMGLVDGETGVRLAPGVVLGELYDPPASPDPSDDVSPAKSSSLDSDERKPATPGAEIDSRGSGSMDSRDPSSFASTHSGKITDINALPDYNGVICLALPEDKTSLSPLRCFLRQNVCAFSATKADIAVRTPTTFSVVLGQVGIGCIHCHKLPPKERVNRAVCYPFSLGRIYQSVADIQRFHLTECKMFPPEIRQKFNELQATSSKGSKGLATRQYWVSSARKLGLVDTSQGIRFGRDPNVPTAPAVSLDILAQVASHVTTVNRPLVTPEDKDTIAEFLYVAMDQLQPCRFTEADRNKRRLKDVGCIGVECKHCAGQAESRKFFWSSVSAVESNFVSVHTHIMECKMAPESLKTRLAELKDCRKTQTSKLKLGSQKAFFARVWNRLHTENPDAAGQPPPPEVKPEDNDQSLSPLTAAIDGMHDKMAVVSV